MRQRFYAALTIAVALGATTLSLASPPGVAQRPAPPPQADGTTHAAIGMGSKSMASCTMDTRKFCPTTPPGVLKECLVSNWDHISSDCQDALGTPSRAGARGD